MHKWFCWGTLKERVNLEASEVGRVILKLMQTEQDRRVWLGLMWLKNRDKWQAVGNVVKVL